MGRVVAGSWRSPTVRDTSALVVTVAFFVIGALAGTCVVLRTSEAGGEALREYLSSFLSAAREGALVEPALPEVLWRALRWPLAAFFLGFTALGLLGVPILAALRGFFLTFSVVSFARAFGRRGLAISFLLLGLPGAFYLPAFFLLCVQSFGLAWALIGGRAGQGRRETILGREQILRCGVCAAAVCIGIFVEKSILPSLLRGMVVLLSQ